MISLHHVRHARQVIARQKQEKIEIIKIRLNQFLNLQIILIEGLAAMPRSSVRLMRGMADGGDCYRQWSGD